MFDHLTGKIEFWHYASPPNCWHKPRTLEPEVEEIEVIVSGRGYFEVNNQVIDAGPGSNLWYCPGDTVIVTSHEEDPYETIVFRFRVSGLPSSRPAPYTRWRSPTQCTEFCRHVLALHREHGPADPLEVACYYARLIWEARDSQRREAREAFPVSLKKALRYIQQNYSKDVSIDQIAAAAGVSPPHLHLLFRTHLSTSPMQHVIRQRIVAAQDLLIKTNHSVKEICHAVGFHDLKYFCTRFKRQTFQRPTDYRKRFAPGG